MYMYIDSLLICAAREYNTCTCIYIVGSYPTRGSSFFCGSYCLGCAVLLSLVVCTCTCMTLLASFFLPSASLIKGNVAVYKVLNIENRHNYAF